MRLERILFSMFLGMPLAGIDAYQYNPQVPLLLSVLFPQTTPSPEELDLSGWHKFAA